MRVICTCTYVLSVYKLPNFKMNQVSGKTELFRNLKLSFNLVFQLACACACIPFGNSGQLANKYVTLKRQPYKSNPPTNPAKISGET